VPEKISVKINGSEVKLSGFIAESATYFYAPRTENEGLYLVAVLNSAVVFRYLKIIKAVRHIHKKIWELPIPEFDASNHKHIELVRLAKSCEAKAHTMYLREAKEIGSLTNIQIGTAGMLRRKLRDELSNELSKIDAIVIDLLKEASDRKTLRIPSA
jgi:hypothetical protein